MPMQMRVWRTRFWKDDAGATAIEYGLIAALVAVAIIGALGSMRSGLTTTFGTISNSLNNASN